ncbi:MAG: hypothetical protein JXA42_21360 [Anaerolineales bacterium]|nr:hypothetical protein [Anaerolineales bacterium]
MEKGDNDFKQFIELEPEFQEMEIDRICSEYIRTRDFQRVDQFSGRQLAGQRRKRRTGHIGRWTLDRLLVDGRQSLSTNARAET